MRRKRLSFLAALSAAACSPGTDARDGRVPGEIINSTATVAALVQEQAPAEQSLLAEMRRRLIVPASSSRWTPDQYTLLLRCREAEKMGAFEFLRGKLGTLRGLAVEFRAKEGYTGLDLTKEGYRKFIFLLSQEAFQFFESKGAEGQWVYQLKTVDGQRLFSDDGMLTGAGVAVYLKTKRRIPAFWKFPNGRIVGTTRPPPDLLARLSAPRAFEPAPASKPLPRPQEWSQPPEQAPEGAAVDQGARLQGMLDSGFIEISEAEERHLLEITRLSERQLRDKSSLEIIPTAEGVRYLLSPSDPLMELVSRYRAAAAETAAPEAAPPAQPDQPKPKLEPTPGVR